MAKVCAMSFLVILLAAPVLRAQKISTEFDETKNFSTYRTFAIRDGQLNSKNPALNNELRRSGLRTKSSVP